MILLLLAIKFTSLGTGGRRLSLYKVLSHSQGEPRNTTTSRHAVASYIAIYSHSHSIDCKATYTYVAIHYIYMLICNLDKKLCDIIGLKGAWLC